MKFLFMYIALAYLVSCADDVGDDQHTPRQRLLRAIAFPVTLNSWFRSNNGRLHRFLTLLWIALIMGWSLSLIADRVP